MIGGSGSQGRGVGNVIAGNVLGGPGSQGGGVGNVIAGNVLGGPGSQGGGVGNVIAGNVKGVALGNVIGGPGSQGGALGNLIGGQGGQAGTGGNLEAFLFWPRLNLLNFISTFFSQLPIAMLPARSPGPVMSPALLSSFQASSSQGHGTFHAQYVMYTPGGNELLRALQARHGSPIGIEITDCGWVFS
jgi:hypothetical protein